MTKCTRGQQCGYFTLFFLNYKLYELLKLIISLSNFFKFLFRIRVSMQLGNHKVSAIIYLLDFDDNEKDKKLFLPTYIDRDCFGFKTFYSINNLTCV